MPGAECEVCHAPVEAGAHKKHLKACWAILAGSAGLVTQPRAPEYVDCEHCKGSGNITTPTLLWGTSSQPCSFCKGTGVRYAWEPDHHS